MIKTKFLPLVLCLALAPLHAAAQTSVDEVVRLDVLDGGQTARGTYLAALRLTLQDGWKTYWRAPGEAGIPPQFNWAGSQNIAGVSVHWPRPEVFHQNGLRSIGYKHQVVLPVELSPRQAGQPLVLNGEIQLGVCQDICVPATLSIHANLPAKSDSAPIKAALAARPQNARAAGVGAVTCRVEPLSDGLRLTARIPVKALGGDEVAVIELSDPSIWISESQVSRQGRYLVAVSDMVPADAAPFSLDRSTVRITLLSDRRAVDIRGCTGD